MKWLIQKRKSCHRCVSLVVFAAPFVFVASSLLSLVPRICWCNPCLAWKACRWPSCTAGCTFNGTTRARPVSLALRTQPTPPRRPDCAVWILLVPLFRSDHPHDQHHVHAGQSLHRHCGHGRLHPTVDARVQSGVWRTCIPSHAKSPISVTVAPVSGSCDSTYLRVQTVFGGGGRPQTVLAVRRRHGT